MMILKRALYLLAALTLVACGGGGGSPGGTTPTTPTTTVTALDVRLSAATIPNSGSGQVTATVTALDANRNAVKGVTLSVAADSGVLSPVGGTTVTDDSGQVVANLTLGSNLALRKITITASTGTISASSSVQVVDVPAGAVPTSIELVASSTFIGTSGDGVVIRAFVKDANNNALPSTSITFRTSTGTLSSVSTSTNASGVATATLAAGADKTNRTAIVTATSGTVSSQLTLPIQGTTIKQSGPTALVIGDSRPFDITLADSSSNPIAGATVTAVSTLGNGLVAQGSAVTNASGQVTFNYTATRAGTDAITFSGAGATTSLSLTVSGQDFTFTSPAASTRVPVNTAQTVQVRLRSGGVAQAGVLVNFTATGGTLSGGNSTASSSLTDAQGLASLSFTSDAAGPVTVQATVASTGASTTLPLIVQATNPTKLVLQISPTAVAPNPNAASNNTVQVTARVTDATGNPVAGQVVNFSRVTDPSGGNLLQASATTNDSGQAIVTYRPGSESTANNGVVISGTVASAPTVTGTATLTVNQTSLFIALGTGNVIENLDPQTYKKDWVVYVTDANGVAVNGATLTIKAVPTYYLTGYLVFDDARARWVYAPPVNNVPQIYQCRNEDANTDGILQTGEDDNGDGVLWPGNVIAVTPSIVQTASGRATVSLTYAESYAPWVQIKLTASATVAGTESRTDAEFIVSGSATDFGTKAIPPAGQTSPYGVLPKGRAVCSAF